MKAHLQKWGNSDGIRIPSNILKSLNIKTNDIVNIYEEDKKIIISKFNKDHWTIAERLENTSKIKGAIICEHIHSIDYKARKLSFVKK